MKTYVVGTHQKQLTTMCVFHGEIKKILCEYPLLSGAAIFGSVLDDL